MHNRDMTQISTTIEVDDEELRYLLITAIEGGTGYWAGVLEYDPGERGESDPHAVIVDLEEAEGGPWEDAPKIRLDLEFIARGLQLWADAYPDRFQRYVAYDFDHDADDADLIVQFAHFGKPVYG